MSGMQQVGRRFLLISGSILGLCADFAVAVVFSLTYSGGPKLPPSASIASVVLVCPFGDFQHANLGLVEHPSPYDLRQHDS